MQYRIYDRKNAPHPNFSFSVEEGTDATLSARAGEEYAFCIGVQPDSDGIIRVTYEPLAGAEGRPAIAETAFDSVSFGGIDYRGNPFEKELIGIKGQRRLLWFTVQVPDDAAGTYRGGLVLGCGEDSARVPLCLSVAGLAADRGWDEPEKLTRLSWLNDTTAQTGGATDPFTQPTLQGDTVGILGREATVTPTGLPGEIATYFDKNIQVCSKRMVLSNGADLCISFADGKTEFLSGFALKERTKEETGDGCRFFAVSESDAFRATVTTVVEFDGFVGCACALEAKRPVTLKDVSLTYTLLPGFDRLMVGLGKVGGACEDLHFQWNEALHQNSLWIGGINGGLRCEFKGEQFREPLVNIYYSHRPYRMPESFANPLNGVPQGGVNVTKQADGARVTAYSGCRAMARGDVLAFDFDFLVTPLKPLDMKQRFQTRYTHFSDADMDYAVRNGASHVISHHASKVNPYINYPFHTIPALKALADEAHSRGLGAKIYYTLREQSNRTCEINAEMSLDDEIYPYPQGEQGHVMWDPSALPTFQKEIGLNRIPGFVTDFDLSVISDGQSRLSNYYIRGLKYLCDKVGIDGIYIDDTACDRYTLRRARRVLDADGRALQTGIGCQAPRKIDMHMWNHYCEAAGYAHSLNMYMPLLPYVDSLWIGESFRHLDTSPEYWLTEIAPVPLGLPGELLSDNPEAYDARYRGMLFGITFRLAPFAEPRQNPVGLWRFIRETDLADSTMIGFWNDESPAHTGRADVKITAFLGKECAVLAIAGWHTETVTVTPTLDDPTYDLSAAQIPEIDNYQAAQTFNGTVTLAPNKGVLITVPRRI